MPSLAVRKAYPPGAAPPAGGFVTSPVVAVVAGAQRVFIGSGDGRFYALDGDSLALLWEYPPAASPALTSQLTCNPSSFGIASTAAMARIDDKEAVIFGAPDQSDGTHLGEGHLFALDARTGALIWRSPVIARLTGTTFGSVTEYHEQIGFSSPLVWHDHVFVGVADHCDDPIQKGRIVSVSLRTGAVDAAFGFCSTATCADDIRGGGVWSSPAADGDSIYAVTGNVKESYVATEPSPNYGLSILRIDDTNGHVRWQAQPVPFSMDADPDFSATPSVAHTRCGLVALATEKDGWTHAIQADGPRAGTYRWSYPPHAIPFTPGDGTVHGDDDYKRAGTVWGDVYVAMNGGLNLVADGAAGSGGLHRLHAFDICAGAGNRLRWLSDVPGTTPGAGYALGQPTVTRGVFYVGTDQGHVVAIADPAVAPAAGRRCDNPDIAVGACPAGHLVFDPSVLADVAVPDTGSIVYSEPALVANDANDGRVYVATQAGHVYLLTP